MNYWKEGKMHYCRDLASCTAALQLLTAVRERERGGAGQEEERGQDGGVQSRV